MEDKYDFLMKCNHKDCVKKEMCARFEDPVKNVESLVPFQNICKEDNNYKWFFKKKEEVTINESK